MRILVCGGRDFHDREAIFQALDEQDARARIHTVIEGGQRTRDLKGKIIGGADFHAFQWSHSRGRDHLKFDANWKTYDRAAGPIRNQRMIDEGKPDMVLAFPGGRGTADMVRRAKAAGIPVLSGIGG